MSRQNFSNKNLPTFKGYNDEQISGKEECFVENQVIKKFSYATEGSYNESELGDSTFVSNRSGKVSSKFSENNDTKCRLNGSRQQKNQKVKK